VCVPHVPREAVGARIGACAQGAGVRAGGGAAGDGSSDGDAPVNGFVIGVGGGIGV
jgi:hypothetical protein